MNAPRFLRGFARACAGLTGLGAFAMFAMAALQDHTATATTAAGLCVALAILAALDLESFEGFGIKAKLQTTLSDAEARLASLDTIIRSLSRSAFIQIARGNLTDHERRLAIDEMAAALRGGGVSDQTIETFKLPLYEEVANRLWFIAIRIKSFYLTEIYDSGVSIGAGQDYERSIARLEVNDILQRGAIYEGSIDNFEQRLEALIDGMPVSKQDHMMIMRKAMSELAEVLEKCRKNGNLTEHTIRALYDDGNQFGPFVKTILGRFY